MNDPVYLYLVMAMRTDAFQASAGEAHMQYLDDLTGRGLLELTGPFTGGSGGAYLLRTTDLAAATQIAHRDPLHTSGSSTLTVHEWRVRRFS
jgi:uncharacterized protein YciI